MNDKAYTDWAVLSDARIQKQLGAYLKHQRLSQNKTQEELSKAAGLSRSTLSLLERGEVVTIATLIQVLRVLGQLNLLKAFEIQEVLSPLALAKEQHKMYNKNKKQRARKKSPAK